MCGELVFMGRGGWRILGRGGGGGMGREEEGEGRGEKIWIQINCWVEDVIFAACSF